MRWSAATLTPPAEWPCGCGAAPTAAQQSGRAAPHWPPLAPARHRGTGSRARRAGSSSAQTARTGVKLPYMKVARRHPGNTHGRSTTRKEPRAASGSTRLNVHHAAVDHLEGRAVSKVVEPRAA
eukprot:135236-Prymnesium_polylepis.2